MRQWIGSHLTFANVVSLAALFIALGGTATAVNYVVSSNGQVGPGTISGHEPPTGKHANIIPGSITGFDIADRSGVDTCRSPLTEKFGPICAGAAGISQNWENASEYCGSKGLRLPSPSEAIALATGYDVPGVGNSQHFWTDDVFYNGGFEAIDLSETGAFDFTPLSGSERIVCVTDPSA